MEYMNVILTLLLLAPAFYWLLVETDYLRVRLLAGQIGQIPIADDNYYQEALDKLDSLRKSIKRGFTDEQKDPETYSGQKTPKRTV